MQAQDSDVDLRAGSRADCLCGPNVKPLDSGRTDRSRCCGAPGLVLQSLHDDVRHVSKTCSGIGGWHRRHGRRCWRHDDRAWSGRYSNGPATTYPSSSLRRPPTLWHYFSFIYCHPSSTQLISDEPQKGKKFTKGFSSCYVTFVPFCG